MAEQEFAARSPAGQFGDTSGHDTVRMRITTRAVVAAALLVVGVALAGAGSSRTAQALPIPRPVGHVFVIVLENENADASFGPNTKAPYLAHTLTKQGTFLRNYFGIGHNSLDNYVAMISGQPPNAITQADCELYTDVVPGTVGLDGAAVGQGCVYPPAVKTIADQLDDAKLTWSGFMEDMGNSATGESPTCRHPDLNTPDGDQTARNGDQYAPRHNPFVYFRSIIDSPRCDRYVVPLERLPAALATEATTPNFTFITPNLCHDGHDAPCTGSNEPGGLTSADRFLQNWVPRITASPAYRKDGMLVVTFDEAETGSDASACCKEPAGPNTPRPGISGPGGGRTGAVVMGPSVRVGAVSPVPYNHYSLLRSIEDVFGLGHLAYAGRPGLVPFGLDVYQAPVPPIVGPNAPVSVQGAGASRPATLPATGRRFVPAATAAGVLFLVAGASLVAATRRRA